MNGSNNATLMESLKKSSAAPLLFFSYRMLNALQRSAGSSAQFFRIALTSREIHTFTYKLRRENRYHLGLLVAKITGEDIDTIFGYFNEIEQNSEICKSVVSKIKKSTFRYKKDYRCDFACRVAFYAIIRALKSKVVVENGMELGFSSVVFCSAIAKNREEGFEGEYYGFDINPDAGLLIKDPQFEPFAHLMIGDGMESLATIDKPIDFYFSDGYRTYEYEKKEFDLLFPKLSDQAVVATNKAIFSTALAELALREKKQFSFFLEQPTNHFYHVWGLGFMYS